MHRDRQTAFWWEQQKQRFAGAQGKVITMLSKCNMAQLPAVVVRQRVCGPNISTRSLTRPVMNMCSSSLSGVWHIRLAPARHHSKVVRRWLMMFPAPLIPG